MFGHVVSVNVSFNTFIGFAKEVGKLVMSTRVLPQGLSQHSAARPMGPMAMDKAAVT